MAAELLARRDLCGDKLRQATLVEFRGSNLSDAGSIPAISTIHNGTFPLLLGEGFVIEFQRYLCYIYIDRFIQTTKGECICQGNLLSS